MEEFNASMSSVRTSVEWLLGDLIDHFKFLDNDLTDMFTFCLLARLGSEKSLSIIDFLICGGS